MYMYRWIHCATFDTLCTWHLFNNLLLIQDVYWQSFYISRICMCIYINPYRYYNIHRTYSYMTYVYNVVVWDAYVYIYIDIYIYRHIYIYTYTYLIKSLWCGVGGYTTRRSTRSARGTSSTPSAWSSRTCRGRRTKSSSLSFQVWYCLGELGNVENNSYFNFGNLIFELKRLSRLSPHKSLVGGCQKSIPPQGSGFQNWRSPLKALLN